MWMMSASFKVDFGGLDEFLKGCVDRISNPHPLMELIGETLVSSTKERMGRGVSPDGSLMKPVRRGGVPLIDTGFLRKSITYNAGLADVTIGSNLVYARMHQFGGTVEPKNKKALAFRVNNKKGSVVVKKVTIPARPFLGISKDDREEIKEMVRLYFSGQK
jgi:phage virion morphogenesis protein